MTTWLWILAAAGVCFALKVLGNLVPYHWLENRRFAHIAAMVTIGLLAAMVVTQTLADGTRVVFDARVAGFAAAVGALWLRAPFIVVVLVGALVTALTRLWFGW